MCGLVGVMGVPGKLTTKIFQDLLQMDVLRGADSTGVLSVNTKTNTVLKDLDVPQFLMMTQMWKEHIWGKIDQNYLLMGHNRAATRGGVTVANAHPFRHGNVALAHNGTLIATHHLRELDDPWFDTDSETITHVLNERGVEWMWEHLDGAAALTWYNSQKDEINFLRNKERSFFYAQEKNNAILLWASERWMIEGAADRNGIEIGQIWSPKPDYHFRFKYNRKKQEVHPVGKPALLTPFDYKAWEEYLKIKYAKEREKWEQNTLLFSLNTNDSASVYSISLEELQKKAISHEDFLATYQSCYFCGDSLKNEYTESVLLDDRKAACFGCSMTADMENLDIRHIH